MVKSNPSFEGTMEILRKSGALISRVETFLYGKSLCCLRQGEQVERICHLWSSRSISKIPVWISKFKKKKKKHAKKVSDIPVTKHDQNPSPRSLDTIKCSNVHYFNLTKKKKSSRKRCMCFCHLLKSRTDLKNRMNKTLYY